MFSTKTSRWFGFLFLVMLALRIGYKYYRTQRPPAAEAQMEQALTRQEALIKAIKADQAAQRAHGTTALLADSAVLATDTAHAAR